MIQVKDPQCLLTPSQESNHLTHNQKLKQLMIHSQKPNQLIQNRKPNQLAQDRESNQLAHDQEPNQLLPPSGAQPTAARAGARPTAARAGDTIESFSLKDLRGLRKDNTRRPDESIISLLVRLWDAAGEATMLDCTEARHLGSLSHDPVIDQEMMMREASPCSLWERVLGSVAQRYLCADDLYMQQTRWKTIEQGIQRLREMAVAEIVFSDDINTRNPDLVPCTPVM
ncbi:hypothetical protein DUI87_19435 [Hirundo rustica rustica]|uniref:Uncharacterized protein n=1 Tax=Hirundo rustica rustica TaxID=333673 RepID=A0A3M0JT44_HIRRU|nr:hypothetical protein DUI87_19435 [Hirundo rustica rustica]